MDLEHAKWLQMKKMKNTITAKERFGMIDN